MGLRPKRKKRKIGRVIARARISPLRGRSAMSKLERSRKSRGLTLHQVARVVGVSHVTIWRIERGEVRPDALTLTRIKVALSTIRP